MNTKYIDYIDPELLGHAASAGGIGVGLGTGFIGGIPTMPEVVGTALGASLGAIPGIYGGAYADKLISPRNSSAGKAIALLIAAGMPITGGLLGDAIGSRLS